MNRFPVHQRGATSRGVLALTVHHWHRQPARLAIIMAAMLASTLADVLMPIYSGRLIDAVAAGAAVAAPTWDSALAAFSVPIALALAAIAMRHIAFIGITDLLLKMMSDVANEAFHHVQRFSTDWHANTFAGSTVRKITRGMWALDLLNSTILLALFPSFIILIGSTAVLGWHWLIMGVIFACGSLI
ncbi:MAG: ABC transporter ATP-binding protein, partial [Mesorhizobium sp.]